VIVRLEAVDADVPFAARLNRVPIDRTGTFDVSHVPPGRYQLVAVGEMSGWSLKKVAADGRDVTGRPIAVVADVDVVITLSDRQSEIRGTVRSTQGAADPDASVVLFTSERDAWAGAGSASLRVRLVRASAAGTYVIRGVPEGEYFIAAAPDEQLGGWPDPRVLELISLGAVRVQMQPDDRKVQHLITRNVR
jgi:hypothetical protein